jgi:hypothetical protein
MARVSNKIHPSIPSSFFSSLSSEQQKQLTQLLHAYRVHYANYYAFCGETIKKSGFIFIIWERILWKEIVKPTGISPNMFRLLLLIWSISKSPKYANNADGLTRPVIIEHAKVMACIPRIYPQNNLRYLDKWGWVRVHKLRWNRKQYFVSDKGTTLIAAYSIRFQELFNQVFEPLNLL